MSEIQKFEDLLAVTEKEKADLEGRASDLENQLQEQTNKLKGVISIVLFALYSHHNSHARDLSRIGSNGLTV